jgi:NAD(P)-dependent dehydrogenase (short-subunit alcohol dehydrogenase family)
MGDAMNRNPIGGRGRHFRNNHQHGPGLESKLALPEQLAPAYVFLASNADSSFITGTILQVMGGETTGG